MTLLVSLEILRWKAFCKSLHYVPFKDVESKPSWKCTSASTDIGFTRQKHVFWNHIQELKIIIHKRDGSFVCRWYATVMHKKTKKRTCTKANKTKESYIKWCKLVPSASLRVRGEVPIRYLSSNSSRSECMRRDGGHIGLTVKNL